MFRLKAFRLKTTLKISRDKIKILVFTSLFPNNTSRNHGVFVKERMSAVARLGGCELKVVAPVPYYPSVRFGWRAGYARVVREEVIDGIEVYHPRYFMIPKVGMVLQGLTMFISLLPYIRKLQRSSEFDLIDAHYVYPDGLAAVLLGAVLNKPVVISARGSDINEFGKFPIIKRLLHYTLKRATHCIAVCQALKNEMTRFDITSRKITVIPNGVDGKKFFPCGTEGARERLGLPASRRIILSVGALIPRKGHDYTIRALKVLIQKNEFSDLLLIIAGGGPDREELILLVRALGLSEQVRFVGEIPHQELRFWYSAADLFCLASDREGWPNVILESLACGTPVIATNIWGVPEIIQSDDIGLLTKRDDNDIAAALHRGLTKNWRREKIIAFAAQHTWCRAAQSVQGVFESVLGVSGRASVLTEAGGKHRLSGSA
jgi:teichuronic acid biosynthesis glycosyltransferase TuaC